MKMLNTSRKYTTGKCTAQYIRKMHQEECSINSENSLLNRLGKYSSESVQNIRKCIDENGYYYTSGKFKNGIAQYVKNAPAGVLETSGNLPVRVLKKQRKFPAECA